MNGEMKAVDFVEDRSRFVMDDFRDEKCAYVFDDYLFGV